MGNKKWHFKGSNRHDEKAARKEKSLKWKSTRGDDANNRNPNNNHGYTTLTENERMELFYKAQKFVPENEWADFMLHLRLPLPACFRLNADYVFVDELHNQLNSFVGKKIVSNENDNVEIHPVQQLAWYPNGVGYQMGTDRRTIRKMPELQGLHKWMIAQSDTGNITRQEAVSMVPPLALNVEPHHKCLDMCAAPGSKTSQLLEIINRSLFNNVGSSSMFNSNSSINGDSNSNSSINSIIDSSSSSVTPSVSLSSSSSLPPPYKGQGLVVANDSDTDRAYMLVHQCKRINSPLLVITTHKGQMFPTLTPTNSLTNDTSIAVNAGIDNTDASSSATATAAATLNRLKHQKDGYFDRVLCDVPCSGDGTLRKNPCIWTKWTASTGMTLHPLQLQIATRGLQLLAEGGLMTYSTCSMSPYENEAVVAELLRKSKGALELVDARLFLPLFKARAGLSSWAVLNDYHAIQKEIQKRRDGKATERFELKKQAQQVQEQNQVQEHTEGVDSSKPVLSDGAAMITETSSSSSSSSSQTADVTATAAAIQHDDDPTIQACLDMGMTYYRDINDVTEDQRNRVHASLFPPTAEEAQWMHLDRCLRCVPHDEDTGGFFVATFVKLPKPLRVRNTNNINSSSSAIDDVSKITYTLSGNKRSMEDDEEEEQIEIEVDGVNVESSSSAVATETEDAVQLAADAAMNDDNQNGNDGDEENTAAAKTKPAALLPLSSGMSQKGLVDFKEWDEASFNKVKSFYGMNDPTLTRDLFMIREDYAANIASKVSSKSVYFMPPAVRDLMRSDRDGRLKIVCAGSKVLEKKVNKSNGDVDYRLIQEGVNVLIPYITERKVNMTIQDFSNLLDGGLVSFSTLSLGTITALQTMSSGGMIAVYQYSPNDVIIDNISTSSSASTSEDVAVASTATLATTASEKVESLTAANAIKNSSSTSTSTITAVSSTSNKKKTDHCLYAICWRGNTRTINVMCGKTEIESMKHQLTALRVLRPKIAMKHIAVPVPITTSATVTNDTAAVGENAMDVKDVVAATTGVDEIVAVSEQKEDEEDDAVFMMKTEDSSAV